MLDLFVDLILGICISLILFYLFYLYLGWSNNVAGMYEFYLKDPELVSENLRWQYDNFYWAILPNYMNEAYRSLNYKFQSTLVFYGLG